MILRLSVKRTDGIIKVLVLPHKDGSGYSFVNLTKGHICPCKFKTIEDAIMDMSLKPNVLEYHLEDAVV